MIRRTLALIRLIALLLPLTLVAGRLAAEPARPGLHPAAAPAAAAMLVAQAAEPAPPSAFRRPAAGNRVAPEAVQGGSLWSRWERWVTDWQRDLSNRMTAAVRRLKTENPLAAFFGLAFVSFVYGIAHAVGPGHGKAVITSYVFANEETLRRGILLAVASSFVQALTAILVISILAIALNATGLAIQNYARHLESASYALVALIGLWLVWGQIRKLWPLWWREPAAAAAQPHDQGHDHAHHHAHDHVHGEACGCGHNHIPAPQALAGDDWSGRKAASIVLAIGLRPCTGALIVLVFAYANGLYWAGIASTFAMAVGTAITISALAALAVGSKQLALQMYGENRQGGALFVNAIALLGGLFVLLLGITLFLGSLGPARPFG